MMNISGRSSAVIASGSNATCELCARGRWSDLQGATACGNACSRGRYNPQLGSATQDACVACQENAVAASGEAACRQCALDEKPG